MGSIYQRADGRWVSVLSLGTENGRRVRRAFYGRDRPAVKAKLRQAQRLYEQGIVPAPDRLTVGLYLREWLAGAAPSIRPRTFVGYEGDIRLHLEPALGAIPLTKLTPSDIRRFVADKLTAQSPRSVARMVTTLRIALSQAVRDDFVPRNVAAVAGAPRIVRHEQRALTAEEVRVFLAAAKGDRLFALYVLAIGTGMRRAELLGLRWEDIGDGQLSIRHGHQRLAGKDSLVEPKSDRSRRTVAISPTVAQALRKLQQRQREERLAAGRDWQTSGLVFTRSDGYPLEPSSVTRAFERRAEAAGLGHVRLHDLRHTAATLLLAGGVPMRVVAEMLGHSTTALTADTYSHVTLGQTAEAAMVLEAALR